MRGWVLAGMGAVAGFAAAVGVGSARAEAPAWSCFVADKFPDVAAARDWRGAKDVEAGLNAVAAHAPAGAVITLDYPMKAGMGSQVAAPLICVR